MDAAKNLPVFDRPKALPAREPARFELLHVADPDADFGRSDCVVRDLKTDAVITVTMRMCTESETALCDDLLQVQTRPRLQDWLESDPEVCRHVCENYRWHRDNYDPR